MKHKSKILRLLDQLELEVQTELAIAEQNSLSWWQENKFNLNIN